MATKISTKGRYGVMAMFDLAMAYGKGPISLKSVAERQGLSENYLEQLIAPLRRVGLVHSIRGAQGGYVLARDPHSMTVGDIIRVLEGPIAPVDCVAEETAGEYCTRPGCVTRNVWAKLRDSMIKVLDSISLADLCEDSRNSGLVATGSGCGPSLDGDKNAVY